MHETTNVPTEKSDRCHAVLHSNTCRRRDSDRCHAKYGQRGTISESSAPALTVKDDGKAEPPAQVVEQ